MRIKMVCMNGKDVAHLSQEIGPFDEIGTLETNLLLLYGHENVLKQRDGTYDTLSKNADGYIDHYVWQVIR